MVGICPFLKRLFYLFMRDTRERHRDIGRERSQFLAASPMWDSIPGPRDHTLSWRQTLNHWATRHPTSEQFFSMDIWISFQVYTFCLVYFDFPLFIKYISKWIFKGTLSFCDLFTCEQISLSPLKEPKTIPGKVYKRSVCVGREGKGNRSQNSIIKGNQ